MWITANSNIDYLVERQNVARGYCLILHRRMFVIESFRVVESTLEFYQGMAVHDSAFTNLLRFRSQSLLL